MKPRSEVGSFSESVNFTFCDSRILNQLLDELDNLTVRVFMYVPAQQIFTTKKARK